MPSIEQHGEEWAVAVLQERVGPEGAAALGVILKRLRQDIREDIRADIREAVRTEGERLRAEIGTLHSEVSTLRSDLGTLRSDLGTLRSDIHTIVRWAVTNFIAVLVVAVGIASVVVALRP